MAPLELLNVIPAGSAGEMEKDGVPALPASVGVWVATGVFTVTEMGEYPVAKARLTAADTLIDTVVVAEAVPSVTVTVWVVAGWVELGVPPMAPLELLNVIPAGRAGEIEKEGEPALPDSVGV